MADKLNAATEQPQKFKGGIMKFTEDDKNRIRRTVRNFNAKNRYNKTKTRGRGMLPRKIYVRELFDKYSDKSKRELNKQLKLYQSFGQRDALDLPYESSRLSKWEANYFKANKQKTINFFENEIADLTRIIGDKPEYHLRQNERLTNLMRQREKLDKDLSTLSEDEIKTLRSVYNYAERSDIVKARGFRLYLSQLERTMANLGYTKDEINGVLNKFNVLSENEFTEMMRNEDLIDAVYDLIDSPKQRGKYQLMTDENRARAIVTDIQSRADELIAKYKS